MAFVSLETKGDNPFDIPKIIYHTYVVIVKTVVWIHAKHVIPGEDPTNVFSKGTFNLKLSG